VDFFRKVGMKNVITNDLKSSTYLRLTAVFVQNRLPGPFSGDVGLTPLWSDLLERLHLELKTGGLIGVKLD
jgi:hypothetical protein